MKNIKQPKSLVLIDGENFFHQISHLLKKTKVIKHRKEIVKFDVRGLIEDIVDQKDNLEIRYYTTRLKLVKEPNELQKYSQSIINHQRVWKRNLLRQNIEYISAGNLKVRDMQKCSKCGHQAIVLQEKGVDVCVAVDIVLAAQSKAYEKIYFVSSDSDLLPAVKVAKRIVDQSSSKLSYVATSHDINYALYFASKSVLTFTGEQVTKFQRVK